MHSKEEKQETSRKTDFQKNLDDAQMDFQENSIKGHKIFVLYHTKIYP